MELPSTYVEGFHDLEAVKKMQYVKLPNTSMVVSRVGFGGAVCGKSLQPKFYGAPLKRLRNSLVTGRLPFF